MILYLDTSDIFKLYVTEPDSLRVRSSVSRASRLASSRLTYVETRSALARANLDHRLRLAGESEAVADSRAVTEFEADWQYYFKISLAQSVLRAAGDIAATHVLRGGDAVHLASALALRAAHSDEVQFSVSDGRLRAAAITEGFVVV